MAQRHDDNSLELILQRAAGGDEAAWRAIIERYSGRVYGLVRAQCGSADLAEEITQSTFVTIVAKLSAYAESGRFEQWLFRIAMNRLRDEMRRRKRQAISIEDTALTGLAGAGARQIAAVPGDPSATEDVEIHRLRKAMTLLPEADRRIIHLRHNAELTFKQIAEVLGQPVGTVLARHHRALRKLRDLIGATDREPSP